MLKKYQMPDLVSGKLTKLIKEEEFKGRSNYYSARSIDKAVHMMIYDVETPYSDALEPILNTLIENKLDTPVKLSKSRNLLPGEIIPWIEMIRISKGIGEGKVYSGPVSYNLYLDKIQDYNKLEVVKCVKEATRFSLKESKEIVDRIPNSLVEVYASKADAELIVKRFTRLGAQCRIKKSQEKAVKK